jgi:DNA-binding Lrp family transcriptional regulator
VTVHAYVLIQTDVGEAAQVAHQVSAVDGVVAAEGVTGPYDVIARAEAGSADRGHHPHHHLSRGEDLTSGRAHAPLRAAPRL